MLGYGWKMVLEAKFAYVTNYKEPYFCKQYICFFKIFSNVFIGSATTLILSLLKS